MDVTSVTLDEVLIAAEKRAASLVPETAGYLALAVADASARLPFRLDDQLVTLTTEGTVNVARGTVVVPPEESARILRNVLARLLERSVGSMPGLAAAARAREEQGEGVTAIVRDLESALVPVNRAAARRALARLARETARARDLGKLKRRARKPGAAPQPSAASQPSAAPLPSAASQPTAAPQPSAASQPSAAPEHALVAARSAETDAELEVDVVVEFDAAREPAEPTPTVVGTSVVEAADPYYSEEELAEPTVVDTVMAERFGASQEANVSPDASGDPGVLGSRASKGDVAPRANASRGTPPREEARVVLAPELASRRGRGYPSQREARIEPSRSDVDNLLASFASASDVETDRAQSELTISLGLEPKPLGSLRRPERTPHPTGADLRVKATFDPETKPPSAPTEAPRASGPPQSKTRSSWAGWLALLALGLVAAGVLGHLAPDWMEPSDQAAIEPG